MSEPLSAATLTAIQARVNAFDWVTLRANVGDAERQLGTLRGQVDSSTIRGLTSAGRSFISNREDIPLLLAEVHRLRTLIGENGETK